MPEASAEIAIGMNSTVLNTVAHRIRSVSTAKINPRIVISVGTTTIQ